MNYVVDPLFEVLIEEEVGTIRAYAKEGNDIALTDLLPGDIELLR